MTPEVLEQLACPKCGRAAKLRVEFHHFADGNRYRMWVECRRWFGVRLCTRGPSHWNFKHWADLCRRCAIEKWNRMAAASRDGGEG